MRANSCRDWEMRRAFLHHPQRQIVFQKPAKSAQVSPGRFFKNRLFLCSASPAHVAKQQQLRSESFLLSQDRIVVLAKSRRRIRNRMACQPCLAIHLTLAGATVLNTGTNVLFGGRPGRPFTKGRTGGLKHPPTQAHPVFEPFDCHL